MKKSPLSAAAIMMAASAFSALAADLPSNRAPPVYIPPPPLMTWAGFYAGLNVGGAFSSNNTVALNSFSTGGIVGFPFLQSVGAAPTTARINNNGFIGGGQIGYNWQFADRFIYGVEADLQGVTSGVRRADFVGVTGGFPVTTAVSHGLDYLGTVRTRLGFSVMPNLLVYGAGGVAYGQTNLGVTSSVLVLPIPLSAATSYSATRVGWTVGGGFEWMFCPNWSAKVEYLYYDLGRATAPPAVGLNAVGAAFAPTGIAPTSRFNGHIVRGGVNYHFNWAPAPVVAKY